MGKQLTRATFPTISHARVSCAYPCHPFQSLSATETTYGRRRGVEKTVAGVDEIDTSRRLPDSIAECK